MASHPDSRLQRAFRVLSVRFDGCRCVSFVPNLVALRRVAAGIHRLPCWKTLTLLLSLPDLQTALQLTSCGCPLYPRQRLSDPRRRIRAAGREQSPFPDRPRLPGRTGWTPFDPTSPPALRPSRSGLCPSEGCEPNLTSARFSARSPVTSPRERRFLSGRPRPSRGLDSVCSGHGPTPAVRAWQMPVWARGSHAPESPCLPSGGDCAFVCSRMH